MRLAQLTVLGLSLVACRGGSGPGDDTPDVDGPIGGSVRVQDVQNDSMPVGTVVELKGVIVTAIDSFGARTGDIWVQDPAGGEFSGIKVFGAPLEQIASLVPGDIITLGNGEKDEFALSADTSGRTVTEIKPAAGGALVVTKTGTGALPTPVTVDAKAIEDMTDEAARDAEWEKWEGVLINVTNARQLSPVTGFSAMNPDQFEFDASGGIAVQSVLADLGTSALVDTCYAGITGVGDYFFNYLLLPTATDKLVTGGTGCSAIVLPVAATIPEVQGGTVTGKVIISDVFVTAISFNKKHVWVQASLTSGSNGGIFVFRGTGAAVLDTNIVVGAKVNIAGTVVENNNDANGETVTQIANGATVTFVAAPTTMPVPVGNMQAAQLTTAGTGEPFESVLVTLTNVKVMSVGTPNFFVAQLKQDATTFLADDDIFRFEAAHAGQCYASITGIWTYQVFDNAYGFLPLAVGTGIGTCP